MSDALMRCSKCSQTWFVGREMRLPEDACTNGTTDHQLVTLCGELSVGVGRKLTCDLHEGHSSRHSGIDEKGIRWAWDAPVMDPKHEMRTRVHLAPDRVERHLDVPVSAPVQSPRPQLPSVGRIVHYIGDHYMNATHAALITVVKPRGLHLPVMSAVLTESDFIVSLHVFYETGHANMQDVPFGTVPGTWNWPPKV